jgi:hypothetical protein
MILAACPYCKVGKVRAPATAVGESATCPRCYNSFTIVDSQSSRSGPSWPASTTRSSAVAVAPELAEPDSDTEKAAEPEEHRPSIVAPLPPPPQYRPRDAESSFALAMVAFVLAGLALPVTYVPYGRLIALVPALAGVAFALLGLAIAGKRRLVPGLALGLNVLLLALLVAFPTWLGLGKWVPPRVESTEGPRLIPFDSNTGSAIHDAWIDAARGGWQHDDVRITVKSSWVGVAALAGPNKAQRKSKETYLFINLGVRNVGGGRIIDFRGWSGEPPPNAAKPRLVDSTGKELSFARFADGWQPHDRKATAPQLYPAAGTDELLVFEPPAREATHVRLELPAWAFGGKVEPARFQIALGAPAAPPFGTDKPK